MPLTYQQAREAMEAAFAAARADGGRAISIAIVDARGDLVVFGRMDGASVLSISIATNKAYTAAILERDTQDFGQLLADRGFEQEWFGDPRLTPLPGGVIIRDGDHLLGAIGVSGRTRETDVALARHALTHLTAHRG
jgi:uncharacterized protein GlcG (DUF336 family)